MSHMSKKSQLTHEVTLRLRHTYKATGEEYLVYEG